MNDILKYDGNIKGDIEAAHQFMDVVKDGIDKINAQLDALSDSNVWSDANSATLISKARDITTMLSKANNASYQAAEEYLSEIDNIVTNVYSLNG